VPHSAPAGHGGDRAVGRGKSSLAFDTVFAEGQRRFVESMSTYARQFLAQMERPPIDAMHNVLPSVALEARNADAQRALDGGHDHRGARRLRLLYTISERCAVPNGHGLARSFSPEEAAAALAAGEAGERFLLLVRLPRPAKQADAVLGELIGRAMRGAATRNEIVRMETGAKWPRGLEEMPIVLGRFTADADPAGSPRPSRTPTASDAAASKRWGGGGGAPRVRTYARELGCPVCGEILRRPTPALFSFNSPLGACPDCQGFGRVVGIDAARVVPDPARTLGEQPIAPWNTPAYEELYEALFAACKRKRIPLDVPWRDLPAEVRQWIWHGEAPGLGAAKFVHIDRFFRWLEGRTYRVHVRVLLARYRAYTPCPACRATRLKPEALAVLVHGETLPALCAKSIEQLRLWLAERSFGGRERQIAGHLLDALGERLDVLHRVGLDYLSLDRQARTLSGGEAQRIHLAAALGSGLTSTLYVLDEPTVGLHPQDSAKLLSLLGDLARRGNTVLVVEHDRTLIRGADWIIDLGPAAGEHGGEVVAEGPLATILESETSLTAHYLRERPATPAREHLARFRREHGRESFTEHLTALPPVEILGARSHNLQGFDVSFPLGALVAVTGVSGSGKSTLVENVLYGTYQRSRGVVDVEPGVCDGLRGLENVVDVTMVDQRPLARSSRSNPVTYLKAYDELRRLFASTAAAKAGGITAAHFSFNLERGRCPTCQGTGVVEVDMQFMAPVTVVCDTCQGHRFQPEVLAVRLRGRNIAETLDLTVEAALEAFADQKRFCARLRPLPEVGLGYLRLGQPTSTLSGGEAQRLKLASFLARPMKEGRRLFLFDEPTTGLHLADIDVLYRTLRRLLVRGDSVVVVEHSLDLVARADWIVELGPGGGTHGGRLLYSGPLAGFVEHGTGPTAEELRRFVRVEEREPVAV
jgi:excinuclease ABC subunit A